MFDLEEQAKEIWLRALQSVAIEQVMRDRIRLQDGILYLDNDRLNINGFDEILLIGFGKASVAMGAAIESLLGERISKGILITNRNQDEKLKSTVLVAGHPFPNENSILAAKRIVELLTAAGKNSLAIFLISGGGSALVELPEDNISLEDLRETNRVLVNSGAEINEINVVRKCLSKIKGGKLRQFIRSSTVMAFYVSDVNSGDLASLASGPLIEEASPTAEDVSGILEKYKLTEKLPASVASVLDQRKCNVEQKRSDETQERMHHLLLLENADAVRIAAKIAEDQGFIVHAWQEAMTGFYQDCADRLIEQMANQLTRSLNKPICIVAGGEVSCPVVGKGIGGRNQEFVLYSALKLVELNPDMDVAILSCGTDGIDGISFAAGAVSGMDDFNLAKRRGIDGAHYLENNDSNSFLKQAGGLMITGPSGNNVRDLTIVLARTRR